MNAMPMLERCTRRQAFLYAPLCRCGAERSTMYAYNECALCELRREIGLDTVALED